MVRVIRYDWAVVRALSPSVPLLLNLCLPFLRVPPPTNLPVPSLKPDSQKADEGEEVVPKPPEFDTPSSSSSSAPLSSQLEAVLSVRIGGVVTLYKGPNFTHDLLRGVPTLAPDSAAAAIPTAPSAALTQSHIAEARELRALLKQRRVAHVDTQLLTLLAPPPPPEQAEAERTLQQLRAAAGKADSSAAAPDNLPQYGRCLLSFATTSSAVPVPAFTRPVARMLSGSKLQALAEANRKPKPAPAAASEPPQTDAADRDATKP
jgi:hypothetical protein